MERGSSSTQPGAPGDNHPNADALSAGARALAQAFEDARAETTLERKRLRRRVWRLRFIAIALVLAVVGVVAAWQAPATGPKIARFALQGVIVDDPKRDALFQSIAADSSVKALILRIDSPGGTTVGGEALYESLRKVSEKKPVVAVMGEVAASAAYIAAMATDHIVARGNTITASIGVIFTAPNFHDALQSLGVEVVEVKSGVQKAEPSPYKPLDETRLASEEVLVDDSFDWFLGLVRERRSLDEAALGQIRDGRILTGRMALDQGLIDALGGESEAVAWLVEERGVPSGLKIVDREVRTEEDGLLGRLLGDAAALTGLGARVDGLLNGPRLMSRVQ